VRPRPPAVASSLLAIAAALAPHSAVAAPRKVLVIAADGDRPAAVTAAVAAVARAGEAVAPGLAVSQASLTDSALIVGCEPARADCRQAVAEQLAVDDLVVVERGADGAIAVTIYGRGRAPAQTSAPVAGPDDRAGLDALGAASARLLGGARPSPDPRGVSSGGSSSPRGALYLGVGGGVLALAGAVAWGLAAAKQGEIDDAPTATADDLAHLVDLEDSGRAYAAAGNALVITGALALVAAGTWYYLGRRRERGIAIAPAVGPNGAAVHVGVRW
jgi:hypothetical protein